MLRYTYIACLVNYTATSLQHTAHFMQDDLPFQLVRSIKTCLTRNLLHTWSVCTIPHCSVVAINKSGRSYDMNILLLQDKTKFPMEHNTTLRSAFNRLLGYRKNSILKSVSENQKKTEVLGVNSHRKQPS